MESETSKNSDQCAVCGGDINETERNTATDSGSTNEHESDNILGKSDKTNIRTMTRSDEDKKSSKKVAMKELQKLMAHLFDDINDVPISDEDDKKKPVQKPADKGAETYSQLCRKYKKVPINNVMRQFGRGVISLDGYDLSTRELKAFFVALLVSCLSLLGVYRETSLPNIGTLSNSAEPDEMLPMSGISSVFVFCVV